MGEGLKQMYSEVSYLPKRIEDEDEDELGESSSLSGGSDDEYESPLDHAATSSSSSSSSSHGPLHELSSLVSQLPIKRGLSKFYRGKSQSFSSFSDVTHVEDLAKKESLQVMKKKKKMMMVIKPSRSYAEGLGDETDENKPSFGGPNFNYNYSCNKREVPRSGRSSCASSVARTTSGCGYFAGGKPPPIPMHKN